MYQSQVKKRYAGRAVEEWERLCSTPIRRTEYLITTHCLNRYLPGKGLILDAGSGPGRYALDLACKGYRVVAFDLLHEMLLFGQDKAAEARASSLSFSEGDIVALPFADGVFDTVISLGAPLSHLTDPSARIHAIEELARVARIGAPVLLTGLARLACYRAAVFWRDFEIVMKPEFRTGGILDGSQVWYNFASGELENLAQQAGLQILDRVGCEGLANHLPFEYLEQVETDPRYWAVWKEILLETCNHPSIIGISNHLLLITSKL